MAIVTGYTAEHMDAIANATVVDGDVVSGHLILTKRDGSTTDAGSVIGATGPAGPAGAGFVICTSFTRPSGLTTSDEGKMVYQTDDNNEYVWDGAHWVPHQGIVPIASCIPYFGTSEPPGGVWKFPNGQLLNVSDYSSLFEIFSTTYGGDGVNNFGIPDITGRTVFSKAGVEVIGSKGGAKTVSLTTAQMPSHTHTLGGAGSHDHSPQGGFSFAIGDLPTSTEWLNSGAGGAHVGDISFTGKTDMTPDHTHVASNVGGGTAHENMPPYILANYLMRCI